MDDTNLRFDSLNLNLTISVPPRKKVLTRSNTSNGGGGGGGGGVPKSIRTGGGPSLRRSKTSNEASNGNGSGAPLRRIKTMDDAGEKTKTKSSSSKKPDACARRQSEFLGSMSNLLDPQDVVSMMLEASANNNAEDALLLMRNVKKDKTGAPLKMKKNGSPDPFKKKTTSSSFGTAGGGAVKRNSTRSSFYGSVIEFKRTNN